MNMIGGSRKARGEADRDGETNRAAAGGPVALKSPRQQLQPEVAPKAPKRSRHARNPFVIALNFFFSISILGLIAAGAVFYWGLQQYNKPGPLTAAKTVVVPKGAGVNSVAETLERNGVIDSPLVFRAGARIEKKQNAIKAGEYLIEKGASMKEVLATLVDGKAVLYKVTLPEGRTSLQIVEILRRNDVLTGEIKEVPPEGSLLPDTYSFSRGDTREQIIEQMKAAQSRALDRIWSRRVDGLPINSPEELVTLASIVEKETGKADERPRVAGVFINRLNRGMKLQSDPTIIYGLFGGAGKPKDRPIYRSDIQKPTAYNSYVIEALPPGPIAHP
ncbi:MAG: endolytic transglycosylase MltG, partial [Pseudomonadota bacterium]